MELLLQLKADYGGSPDPTLWTQDGIDDLLLHVYPRKVVDSQEHHRMVPTVVVAFFSFLQENRTWSRRSEPTDVAIATVEALQAEFVQVTSDPSKRTHSGNILAYAQERGLNPMDPGALDALMSWHNSLTHEERIELTDTGRLSGPPSVPFPESTTPFRRSDQGGHRGVPESDHLGGFDDADVTDGGDDLLPYPWFLPEPPSEPPIPQDPDEFERQLREATSASRPMQCARIMLDLMESGPRRVTTTGALRLKETQQVLDELGMQITVRSMWDVPVLDLVWRTLTSGGWIDVGTTTARRGPLPWSDQRGSQDDTAFSITFHTALLYVHLTEDVMMDDVSRPDLLGALLVASESDGLLMPPHREAPDTDGTVRWIGVYAGLRALAAVGLLQAEDRWFGGGVLTWVCALNVMELLSTAEE